MLLSRRENAHAFRLTGLLLWACGKLILDWTPSFKLKLDGINRFLPHGSCGKRISTGGR